MNFDVFKTFSLTWWQAGIFKIGLVSFGILLTLYFPKFFKKYKAVWWALAAFCLIYITAIWLRQ